MSKDLFDFDVLLKIIKNYEDLGGIPESHLDLYESPDAVMWDGYIKSVVDLNEAVDNAFRFNPSIEPVDVSEVYKDGGIEALSLEQVGFVMRDILVNEKFHQGLFADVIMDGKIERLISRLKELCL